MLWPWMELQFASTKVDGQPDSPRYAQAVAGQLESSAIELRDDQ